jgi:hypothetical protein
MLGFIFYSVEQRLKMLLADAIRLRYPASAIECGRVSQQFFIKAIPARRQIIHVA